MPPWKIFYSYSHRDADLREQLATYLAPLRPQKIVEWHDRKIEPGGNWETEISGQLDTAHLIVLLVSADFLNSEYCYGIEVERALTRLKRGEVKVVPMLLKPCLWQESRFSELQMIPRDAKPVISWSSREEALAELANEIRMIVSNPPPLASAQGGATDETPRFDASLNLVRSQVHSYARLYERTRQRIRPSSDRTARMEQIFAQMRALATAAYPLLAELAGSPLPGERLAAIAILQVFAHQDTLDFLVRAVGSEKPFVGYHAIRALHFAVGALDAQLHPRLLDSLQRARQQLDSASGDFADRQTLLRSAEEQLRATIESLSAPEPNYD